MKLFAASLSDKTFHLDLPPLFTVFATSDVIQMQKLCSSNVLLWGHASVWILQLKQQLNKNYRVFYCKSQFPHLSFVLLRSLLLSLSLTFLARHGKICIWFFCFNIELVIAIIIQTLSKRGAGEAQPTFYWMSTPCSKIAEFSLLVFLPLFSNCWSLKKKKIASFLVRDLYSNRAMFQIEYKDS